MDPSPPLLPIAIIGSGPHALALVCKLYEESVDPFEENPANAKLFRQHDGKVTSKYKGLKALKSETRGAIRKKLKVTQGRRAEMRRISSHIRVFDTRGTWCAQWDQQFKNLGITVLRSALNAHVDPTSWEALEVDLNERKDRERETVEFHELDADKSYRGPFQLPTSRRYRQFTQQVIRRYGLQDKVEKKTLVKIRKSEDHFELEFETGERVFAKNVVLGCGPLCVPHWPEVFSAYDKERCLVRGLLLHSCDYMKMSPENLDAVLGAKRRIVVVGGGLTSAHIALSLCSRSLQTNVIFVARKPLQVKPFDIDSRWMGTQRNIQLAKYWSIRSPEQRFKLINETRGGGSITPVVWENLQEARERQQLTLLEDTEIVDLEVTLNAAPWNVILNTGEEYAADLIVVSTGTETNVHHDPLLSQLVEESTALYQDRFPLVTEDLRLNVEENVFLLGVYASYQLGPGALNLMGARAGAARISKALKQQLEW